MVLTSDGRQNIEIDTGISKASGVLNELHCYGSFWTLQSCQYLNRYLFRSWPVVIHLGESRRERYLKSTSGKDGIFVTNSQRGASRQMVPHAAVKFVKHWISNHISESKYPRMCQETSPRQVLLVTTTGTWSRGRPRTRWCPEIDREPRLRPCLAPSWCGASRNIRNCWKPWSIPRSSIEEKWVWKWVKKIVSLLRCCVQTCHGLHRYNERCNGWQKGC